MLSQWFPPEPGGGPARFSEMAREWQEQGHDVRIIAGVPNWPDGRIHPGYGRKTVREVWNGLPVIRARVHTASNESARGRVLNHLSFMASATAIAIRDRRPDVVVTTSPPLFAGVAGLVAARRFRVPFVLDVRDLWPDAIFALGRMQLKPIATALRWVERRLYRSAAAVVCVSEAFERHILEHGAQRVRTIPNGADLEGFRPGPPDASLRHRLGWDGRFVVLYAGTIGEAHGLDTMLEAAQALSSTNAHFVLAGEGAHRARLQRRAAELGLSNVQFLPMQPRSSMASLYRSADISLVALRPLPLFQAFIPSKIFEILACGRPMLAAVEGVALRLLRQSGAAIEVATGSGQALAAAVRSAMSDPELGQKGAAGRSYVAAGYDRARLARRYADVLRDIVGGERP